MKPKAAGLGAATASSGGAPDPVLDPLVHGELADAGRGTDLGYTYVFSNATMDAAFKQLCAHWGIPLFPPSVAAATEVKAKPEAKPGGDSGGLGVDKLPAWFNLMQNKVIGATQWTRVEKASQAFLEAFLRANYPDQPASIKTFFHHVGKSETNKASDEMVPGSTSSDGWCQGASTLAVVKALADAGYRFKARTAPRDLGPGIQKGSMVSAGHQDLLYVLWVQDHPEKAPPGGAAASLPPPHVIGLPAAASAPLEPGDIISLVTSQTPSSGHVGTVVALNEPVITMVSGNAGGAAAHQGAIRIENVRREPLEEGARWDQSGGPKVPGKTVPSKAGVCWVVSVQKTSQLDPRRLDKLDDDALEKLGLEKHAATA